MQRSSLSLGEGRGVRFTRERPRAQRGQDEGRVHVLRVTRADSGKTKTIRVVELLLRKNLPGYRRGALAAQRLPDRLFGRSLEHDDLRDREWRSRLSLRSLSLSRDLERPRRRGRLAERERDLDLRSAERPRRPRVGDEGLCPRARSSCAFTAAHFPSRDASRRRTQTSCFCMAAMRAWASASARYCRWTWASVAAMRAPVVHIHWLSAAGCMGYGEVPLLWFEVFKAFESPTSEYPFRRGYVSRVHIYRGIEVKSQCTRRIRLLRPTGTAAA